MQIRPSGEHGVSLDVQIDKPAESVFDAFVSPDLLSKWFTTSAEADLRVGGRYRNADHDEGKFLVIDRPHEVRFTWENADHCPGTVVEVEFRSLAGDRSTVSLHHREIQTEEGAAEMKQGWSWALDSLKSFMEWGVPIPHSEWEAAKKQE